MQLDDTDHAIIRVLENDGRKSFRQIAKETGISTPTVKARFDRLINIGFLKSVSPIFDFTKIETDLDKHKVNVADAHKDYKNKSIVGKNTKIKLICDFCEGPISGEAHVFRFAEYERFSVVPNAGQHIRKSIEEELRHLLGALKNRETETITLI